MAELLRASGVRLGLVTNGEHWMLVHAPKGETTSFISWYAELWLEERLTLRAFHTLLGVRRFFGPPDDTPEQLLERSAANQQEVTDQLGYQVRQAVEVLVRTLDRIDQDYGRTLLVGQDIAQVYESALTVMMRLVILFSAEERSLLLLGTRLYDQYYAVSTLRAQLREMADQHGEEVLERRADAWSRLLATFRAVFGGVQHEDVRLPAYGSALFDPDRFPFLEVLVLTIVSRTVAFAMVPTEQVYAHRLAVFAFDSFGKFAVLQSNMHYDWAWQYSSTMKADLNYSPSDCFETFPFPDTRNPIPDTLSPIGEQYHEHRRQVMLTRQEGLTKTYNRFHDPDESAEDIATLRRLHTEMDAAVAAAYGWHDLDLGHGFHATKQGTRYTISEAARREVLDRLLALNHERYAEEVAAGLHEKGKGKAKKGTGRKGKKGTGGDAEQGELL
jgi:hypothetical protein